MEFGFNVQFLFTVVEKEDWDPCIKLCVCVVKCNKICPLNLFYVQMSGITYIDNVEGLSPPPISLTLLIL